MRWIFLTLLLLNALFAAMEWSSQSERREILDKPYQVIGGGERLTLLRESGGFGEAGVVPGAQPEIDSLCLLLGPLKGEVKAVQLLSAFQDKSIKAELVTQDIVKAPNYWVYLAPFDSRKAAITKLRELQSVKVDSYLITQGELANGISLGVFENIDSARRMSKRRIGQGYDVKIAELDKKEFEYWVAVMEGYTEELDVEVSKLIRKLEMSFEKRQIFCKSVASEK